MAPEVQAGGDRTQQSDVFGLGQVLKAVMRGAEGWGGRGQFDALLRRLESAAPMQRPAAAEVSRTLRELAQDTAAASGPETRRGLPRAPALPPSWARGGQGAWGLRYEMRGEHDRAAVLAFLERRLSNARCRAIADPFRVVSVERVENPVLWRQYQHTRAHMQEMRAMLLQDPRYPALGLPIPPHPFGAELDGDTNEYLLLHGTTFANAAKIVEQGFDARLSRLGGLYGAGVYFTDETCKALQRHYAKPDLSRGGQQCLLVCRVTLGHVYKATRGLREDALRRAPLVSGPGLRRKGLPHDSVFADPQAILPPAVQCHREFVVYEGGQVYPEYVVAIHKQRP